MRTILKSSHRGAIQPHTDGPVVLLDPAISSANMGDQIIRQAVERELSGRVDLSHALPTQVRLSREQARVASAAGVAIVGGTNLLSSNMPWYMQWKLDPRSISALRGKVVLMGVGWWQYQPAPNAFTRRVLSTVLSRRFTHSVRDEYTRTKLAELGFDVLNTACPTMWAVPDRIPLRERPDRVVVTLTDYNKDPALDRWLIDTLARHYSEVVVWPQSRRDEPYARQLGGRFTLLDGGLSAYDDLLRDGVDYVGTRLHGGIRALERGSWGLIAAVDNRAIEIGRDTGLPVIARSAKADIETAIANRNSITLRLPRSKAAQWLEQFASDPQAD